jgi:hypothetical protein
MTVTSQIDPVALRGLMDMHIRHTLLDLYNFFYVISQKSICTKHCHRLLEEIVVILCELEIYFPPTFFGILLHLLIHIFVEIIDLGPVYLHNMFPFEKMNRIVKQYVRNRSHPDGCIIQGFLAEECIMFCMDYMEVDKPIGLSVNKHVGRLEGIGHKEEKRDLHVEFDVQN